MTTDSNRPSSEKPPSTHLPPNPYIFVSLSDIKLGEVLFLGFRHTVEDVMDQGQGVGVLYGHHIELSIILDEVEAPVLLFDEENQGCHW